MSRYSSAALVIIGHGSTLNPDSSAPTLDHAAEIRRRGLFKEVACAFWKEEPSMREVYEMVDSQEIYVVPNFISEGYFCQQVLPRELQLTGPTTQLGDKTVHYCDPVGIHPNMTRLLLQRADEVAAGVPREQTSLIIVGHGTSLNDNSTKAITDQVQLIRDGGYGFAEVVDAYMEEAPFVAEWDKLTTAPNVVVVPFFIADGLHSYQDIPVLLGMETEPTAAASERDIFRHNPYELRNRKIYYSSAIGTERLMADIVLDQVAEFDKKHAPAALGVADGETLEHWLKAQMLHYVGQLQVGQVQISQDAAGHYRLTHVQDANNQQLATHTDPEAARTISNVDHAGTFRPLKSAPTLQHGWALDLPDLSSVLLALNYFYPAAVGMAQKQTAGTLQAVPLRQTLGRQTGMYKFSNSIRDDQAGPMVSKVCADTNCMRRILWDLTSEQPLASPEKRNKGSDRGALPLLCIEACTHIVGEARKIAKKNFDDSQAQG
jgi:sirohydrochlorin cobaltochelatase